MQSLSVGVPRPVDALVRLAVAIAEALADWHERHGPHTRLGPDAVLVDGSAVRLVRPDVDAAHLLPYTAPEQTGRLARGPDERTDLYALGCLLYHLTTGRPPVVAGNADQRARLILTTEPLPPSSLVPALPPVLDDMVRTLLAVVPEDRYRTAHGLAADLRRCRDDLDDTGRIGQFLLCGRDVPARPVPSGRLYGREARLARLVAARDRVAGSGGTELVSVTADAGLGKTALLNAFTDATVRAGGRVARTTFSALDHAPYAGVRRLFADLAQQLAMEADGRPRAWRDRLAPAVGTVADALASLVPALEPLLGTDDAVSAAADRGGEAARNRLHLATRRLLAALGEPGRPLVLCLDDLHRADAASMELLRYATAELEAAHLLVVLAYRPKEVPAGHALPALLRDHNALRQGATVPLRPIPDAALADLLADALGAGQRDASVLSRAVAAKTGSNPLAVNEFLARLREQGLLVYDPDGPAWRWDVEKVGASDRVTDLAAAVRTRLDRYPPAARRILHTAALLADAFTVADLSAVTGRPQDDPPPVLRRAVADGLLTLVAQPAAAAGVGYRWAHEVLRLGVLTIAGQAETAPRRLAIGTALAADAGSDPSGERLFAAAAHLSAVGYGVPRGPSLAGTVGASSPPHGAVHRCPDADRLDLAALHRSAAAHATRIGALAAARDHLTAAVALLSDHAWSCRPALACQVHAEAAEALAATGSGEQAAALLDAALERAADGADGYPYLLRARAARYRDAGEPDAALRCTVEALNRLGVDLASGPEAVAAALAARTVEDVVGATPADEPRTTLAAGVIADALTLREPVGRAGARLAATGVRLALAQGPTPAAALAFACHAALLADRAAAGNGPASAADSGGAGDGGPGPVDRAADGAAVRAATIAFRLLDTLPAGGFTARVEPAVARVRSLWYDPAATLLERLGRAYRDGADSGDRRRAVDCRVLEMVHRFVLGVPLDALADEVDTVWRDVERDADDLTRVVHRALGDAVGGLYGSPPPAPPRTLPESTAGTGVMAGEAGYVSTVVLTLSLVAAYLLGDRDRALALAATAGRATGGHGSLLAADAVYYRALCLTFGDATGEDDPAELDAAQALLDDWAAHGPTLFSAKAMLVAAERARRDDDHAAAATRYDRAIDAAREHGLLPVEAVAAELGGRYALSRGDTGAAVAYLRRARACYDRWSAHSLVARVDQTLAAAAAPAHAGRALDQLDMLAIVRAFQAISAELGLDRLVVTLLELLVQHSHASRGALLLARPGEDAGAGGLRLAAVATLDRGQVTVVPEPAGPLGDHVPAALVDHVHAAREAVRGDTADLPASLTGDPYLRRHRPRTVLCTPIVRADQLMAVLYLEHRLLAASFTPEYLELLDVLCAQAAIALENATVHARLLEANRILDATFDRLPVGLILLGPDLTVRRASPRAVEVTGLPIAPGTPLVELLDVLTPTDAGADPYRYEPGSTRVATGTEPIQREIPIIAPNGERRLLRTSAIPLRDGNGVLVGVTLLVS
jgi:PAS domain-containing protein